MVRSVLFVCTANRCRSPMAAALLRQRLDLLGAQSADWQVESAGTWAEQDQPATALAIDVMRERGLDISGHQSRLIDRAMLKDASIVLVMTRHHQEALQIEFPEFAAKVHLMSELIDRTFDIADPFGGTEEDYRRCAANLEEILKTGFDRLLMLSDEAGEEEQA
jgi:protein-tyrosine phosphatase